MKLTELLGEDDFLLGVPSREKRSALEAVASWLANGTGRPKGEVLNALLCRERLGSTATGEGLAMSHAAFAGISVPAAVIATMKHPVTFDAPDDGDVDLLLGLLWPSDVGGFFLTLLQSSRLLHQPGFGNAFVGRRRRPKPTPGSKPLRLGVASSFAALLPWGG